MSKGLHRIIALLTEHLALCRQKYRQSRQGRVWAAEVLSGDWRAPFTRRAGRYGANCYTSPNRVDALNRTAGARKSSLPIRWWPRRGKLQTVTAAEETAGPV